MANTTNYGFNLIDDGASIHIQRDVNTPIEQIDAQMKSNADAVTTAIGDEHDATILREAAIVDDFNDALSDASTTMMVAVAKRDEFAGKNIVFIGDSYTYGTGSATHSGVTRTDYKTTNDSQRWSSLFASMLNANEYNYAFGATGFIRENTTEPGYTSEDLRFIKQIDIAESHMTADEIADTRLVVIAGGINDARHNAGAGAQFQSAAQACCERAKAAYPNALVMLVPMLWYGANWNETVYNYWLRLKLGGMQAGANVLVVDNAWTWLFAWGQASTPWWNDIHPTATGHYKIAEFALSALNGGNTMGNGWDTIAFESGWSNYSDAYFNFSNGVVSLLPCYINGGLSAGTTKIGVAPLWAAPDTGRTNIYIPIVKGNNVVGTLGIVAGSGNINAHVDSAVSSGFYVVGGSWQPSGIMPS